MTRLASEAAFTLLELLVATTLTLTVTAAVFTVLTPAQSAFVVQPEAADVQQRLRVAVDALTRELVMAGAGTWSRDGALYQRLTPVFPYRVGDVANDARTGIHYRADALSVLYAPSPPTQPSTAYTLGPGTVQVVAHVFYLKALPGAGVSQLMHYDGGQGDFPVLDDVVRLGFEYFGEPQPPRLWNGPLPAGGGLRATYGPVPPPLEDDPADTWGAGENCTFAVVNGQHRSRMATLAPLAAPVRLPPEMLTDGPWCPDAASADRFDADLLRIRRIRVRLRVQASRTFRGSPGVLFMQGGTASNAARYVPDQEIRFDVAPRNMNP